MNDLPLVQITENDLPAAKRLYGGVEYGLSDYAKDKSIPVEERVRNIQAWGDNERKKIDDDLNKYLAKQYAGAALEIGSAAIPVGAGLKLGTTAIKALAPTVGKAIAKEVGTGLAGGALSGGVFGFGRGLTEDENPFKTAAQDAAMGLVLGGAAGYGAGKLGKQFAKRSLYKNAGNEEIANKYFDNYIDGLNDYTNDWREFNRLKLGDNYGGSGKLFDNSDNFVDLTNSFQEKPTLEDAKNFVNEANVNGTVFETASPDYYIDMYGNAKKRHHIVRSSKFGQMSQDERDRHNVYINSFDKISPKLRPKGKPVPNAKIDKKPNIDKYHYFETNIKNGDDLYPITVSTEQYIGEPDVTPQTVHLYDLLENKKPLPTHNELPSVTAGSDTNIIPDYDKNLKSYMKNSKVVDKKGKPLKVYHGTDKDFNIFEPSSPDGTPAIYFSSSPTVAKTYAGDGGNVMPSYLNIENPFYVDAQGKNYNDFITEMRSNLDWASRNDYDGAIIDNIRDNYAGGKGKKATTYVVFDPTQIKSVNNEGTFDPTNPNIYKSILGGLGLAELLKRQSALYDGLTQQ